MQTIQMSGDIDFRRASQARDLLLLRLAESDGLVVDMSDVYRIDSAGLASLVEVVQAARIAGRPFQLRRVRDGVEKIIRFARLDRVFLDAEPGGPQSPSNR